MNDTIVWKENKLMEDTCDNMHFNPLTQRSESYLQYILSLSNFYVTTNY